MTHLSYKWVTWMRSRLVAGLLAGLLVPVLGAPSVSAAQLLSTAVPAAASVPMAIVNANIGDLLRGALPATVDKNQLEYVIELPAESDADNDAREAEAAATGLFVLLAQAKRAGTLVPRPNGEGYALHAQDEVARALQQAAQSPHRPRVVLRFPAGTSSEEANRRCDKLVNTLSRLLGGKDRPPMPLPDPQDWFEIQIALAQPAPADAPTAAPATTGRAVASGSPAGVDQTAALEDEDAGLSPQEPGGGPGQAPDTAGGCSMCMLTWPLGTGPNGQPNFQPADPTKQNYVVQTAEKLTVIATKQAARVDDVNVTEAAAIDAGLAELAAPEEPHGKGGVGLSEGFTDADAQRWNADNIGQLNRQVDAGVEQLTATIGSQPDTPVGRIIRGILDRFITLWRQQAQQFLAQFAAPLTRPIFWQDGRRDPLEVGFGSSGQRGRAEATAEALQRYRDNAPSAPKMELTDLEVYLNTVAYLDFLVETGDSQRGDTVSLAGDLRTSSPRILAATHQAIVDAGFRVDFQGITSTPAVSWWARQQGRPAIMVTGSHIPMDYNGIKHYKKNGEEILKADEPAILKEVRRKRQEEYRKSAADTLFDGAGMFKQPVTLPTAGTEAVESYKAHLQAMFPGQPLAGRRIGMWQHSSVARDIAVEAFQAMGADVKPLGRLPDGVFRSVDTENIKPEDLAELERLTADDPDLDVIISFDGDGDRPMLFVRVLNTATGSREWTFVRGDALGMATAIAKGRNAIVVPVTMKPRLNAAVRRLGMQGRYTLVGSPYVIAEARRWYQTARELLFGVWEGNGGYIEEQPSATRETTLPTRDAADPLATVLRAAAQNVKAGQTFGDAVWEHMESLELPYLYASLLPEFPRERAAAIMAAFAPAKFNGQAIKEAEFTEGGITITLADDSTVELTEGSEAARQLRDIHARLSGYFTGVPDLEPLTRINFMTGVQLWFGQGDVTRDGNVNVNVVHLRASGNADEFRCFATSPTFERAQELVQLGIRDGGILRTMEADLQAGRLRAVAPAVAPVPTGGVRQGPSSPSNLPGRPLEMLDRRAEVMGMPSGTAGVPSGPAPDAVQRADARFEEILDQVTTEMGAAPLVAGVPERLGEFAASGLVLAVATGSKQARAEAALTRAGLAESFRDPATETLRVFGTGSAHTSKGDTIRSVRAAVDAGKTVVVIGDGQVEMQAAAGVPNVVRIGRIADLGAINQATFGAQHYIPDFNALSWNAATSTLTVRDSATGQSVEIPNVGGMVFDLDGTITTEPLSIEAFGRLAADLLGLSPGQPGYDDAHAVGVAVINRHNGLSIPAILEHLFADPQWAILQRVQLQKLAVVIEPTEQNVIVQPTWGGTRILEEKGIADDPRWAGKRVGQFFELSGATQVTVGGVTMTMNDAAAALGEKFLGRVAAQRYQNRMRMLIKLTDAQGNSFQIHLSSKRASHPSGYRQKAESWHWLSNGLMTYGIRIPDGQTWEQVRGEYEAVLKAIDAKMSELSAAVRSSAKSVVDARAEATAFIKAQNPYRFINIVVAGKDEVTDLSAGGIHHSWESIGELEQFLSPEDLAAFRADLDKRGLRREDLQNYVYEVQVDEPDDAVSVRAFDKGKMGDDGKLRRLDVQSGVYADMIDGDPTLNNPASARVQSQTVLQTAQAIVRHHVWHPMYAMQTVTIQPNGILDDAAHTDTTKSFHHYYVNQGQGVRVIFADGRPSLEVPRGRGCFLAGGVGRYRLEAIGDQPVELEKSLVMEQAPAPSPVPPAMTPAANVASNADAPTLSEIVELADKLPPRAARVPTDEAPTLADLMEMDERFHRLAPVTPLAPAQSEGNIGKAMRAGSTVCLDFFENISDVMIEAALSLGVTEFTMNPYSTGNYIRHLLTLRAPEGQTLAQRMLGLTDDAAWATFVKEDLPKASPAVQKAIKAAMEPVPTLPSGTSRVMAQEMLRAMLQEAESIEQMLRRLKAEGKTGEQAYWDITEYFAKKIAARLRPFFERSGGETGFVSIEVDPRWERPDFFAARGAGAVDAVAWARDGMIAEARHLTPLASNILVKVPNSPAGLATARALPGVAFNMTLTFSRDDAIEALEAFGPHAAAPRKRISPFVSRNAVYFDEFWPALSALDVHAATIANTHEIFAEMAAAGYQDEAIQSSLGGKIKGDPQWLYAWLVAGISVLNMPPEAAHAFNHAEIPVERLFGRKPLEEIMTDYFTFVRDGRIPSAKAKFPKVMDGTVTPQQQAKAALAEWESIANRAVTMERLEWMEKRIGELEVKASKARPFTREGVAKARQILAGGGSLNERQLMSMVLKPEGEDKFIGPFEGVITDLGKAMAALPAVPSPAATPNATVLALLRYELGFGEQITESQLQEAIARFQSEATPVAARNRITTGIGRTALEARPPRRPAGSPEAARSVVSTATVGTVGISNPEDVTLTWQTQPDGSLALVDVRADAGGGAVNTAKAVTNQSQACVLVALRGTGPISDAWLADAAHAQLAGAWASTPFDMKVNVLHVVDGRSVGLMIGRGEEISRQTMGDLLAALDDVLSHASALRWMVMTVGGGIQFSDTPWAYREMVRAAHQHGKQLLLDFKFTVTADEAKAVLMDEDGTPLRSAEAPADILTPNAEEFVLLLEHLGLASQTEFRTETGQFEATKLTDEKIQQYARRLIEAYHVQAVVVKRGANGAVWVSHQSALSQPAPAVAVKSDAAAGDAFNAGLALALAEGQAQGQTLEGIAAQALRKGVVFGTATVTLPGTQVVTPASLNEVMAALPAAPAPAATAPTPTHVEIALQADMQSVLDALGVKPGTPEDRRNLLERWRNAGTQN